MGYKKSDEILDPREPMHYLQLHKGFWRVRMVVPPSLVPIIGKGALLRGTGTADFDRAVRIAAPHVKRFTRIIRRARGLRPDEAVHIRHSDRERRSSEWYTPPAVFAALEVKFDMDVASP